MGVLKVKVGGSWVEIPGLIASPNLPAAATQFGAYTPTLSGINIGTGGQAKNVANYVYVGGPSVGDKGIIHCSGQWVLGTSGFSVPGGTASLSLPTGFNFYNEASNTPMGSFRILDASPASWIAVGYIANTGSLTMVNLEASVASTAYTQMMGLGPTVPMTWAQDDTLWWNFTANVVRV